MKSRMGFLISFAIFFLYFTIPLPSCLAKSSENQSHTDINGNGNINTNNRENIQVKGGPEDLVWVVQLSDLHFSVHHPERAQDFRNIVGPTLSFINPSLVFITGDLTDGKSKDLLTTKQDEAEWVEYQNVMHDVIKRSGLNKSSFYDLRGNHDNFGVPVVDGPFDFFSKYSLNGQLKRSGKVNSITVQTSKRKLLFVGFDSTMSSGLRGPTNLFGHPTDELLTKISSELLLLDSPSTQPVTKISFGHFPLSFSAASNSGKTLKDIFLNNSLSVYLCGHLHTRFGKNLKRHHESSHYPLYSNRLFQLNAHRIPSENTANSNGETIEEFWEWEMGDWRKSRAMRILAIDRGLISFVDIDFKLRAEKTLILPTFPPDSRFTTTSFQNHNCQASDPSSCGTVRALVFSASPIVSVVATVYDSSPEKLIVVMETPMTKLAGSRGDLYVAPLNFKAFEDPSPERFFLQIQATDIMGRSTYTERRPFSANGLHAKLSWNWREFIVMGCQWDALYYPILWSLYYLVFSILLIPKIILSFSKMQYTYRNFKANKGIINGLAWIFAELYKVPVVWYSMVGYMLYLVLCPWFSGQILSEGMERGYMTYRGWVLKINEVGKLEFLGFPDVMVVVLPHLFFMVLPAFTVIMALAAERGLFHDHFLSVSSKKKDDHVSENKESVLTNNCKNRTDFILRRRWIRKILLVICLVICWTHFKNCRALTKAYEMNPVIHYPVYSLAVPLMLAYTIYKTRRT
ncbi:putative metallophosphoesterase [Abeliophyllum distichum]|uniref:Metallophosphoesterase n=1 Tax=Abeliophyllum distichum TaxID=126358 RepID=A0ABD1UME8_9LAMI